jgi:hypothetical protein
MAIEITCAASRSISAAPFQSQRQRVDRAALIDRKD